MRIIFTLFLLSTLFSNTVSQFGSSLFNDSFSNSKQLVNFSKYIIQSGDKLKINIWGSINVTKNIIVDSKGNFFLDKLGVFHIQGIEYSLLDKFLLSILSKKIKGSINIYTELQSNQSTQVFLTGHVIKPGKYKGNFSDDVIEYLNKASGIEASGDLRHISILRDNKTIKVFDLYSYIDSGVIDNFQFNTGDVIFVPKKKNSILISSESSNIEFSLLSNSISISSLLKSFYIKPTINQFILKKYIDSNEKSVVHSITDKVIINSGDKIIFFENYNSNKISITLSGEHNSNNKFFIKKGTKLSSFLDSIVTNNRSDIKHIKIFRESIKKQQQALFDKKIFELKRQLMSSPIVSKNDGAIKEHEGKLLSDFITNAESIELPGLLSVTETDYDDIFLEKNDVIFIPSLSNIIYVNGEVSFPNTQIYDPSKSVIDYINDSGGFLNNANSDSVVILSSNGKAKKINLSLFSTNYFIKKGDSILVLPENKINNIELSKSISEIVYHIAISAGVVIGL